jgi:hypothetical protein
VFATIGGTITWFHGKKKYDEGMIFTLIELEKGTLTYDYKEDGDDVFLRIKSQSN